MMRPTELDFRSATNADIQEVRALVAEVLAEYGLPVDHSSTDADLSDVEAYYARRGGVFEVVVDASGRIVGTAGLYRVSDSVCELRKMYLRKELRGRGIGRTLLERMLSAARTRGFSQMELETAGVLVEAIGLYESYGFRPVDDASRCSTRCDRMYALRLTADRGA